MFRSPDPNSPQKALSGPWTSFENKHGLIKTPNNNKKSYVIQKQQKFGFSFVFFTLMMLLWDRQSNSLEILYYRKQKRSNIL